MKVNIYTIYDKVACESGPIFQAKNDTVALRCFMSLMKDTPSVNPTDYDVYCLGEFDTEARSFVPVDNYGRLVIENLEDNSSVDIQEVE